MTRIVIDVPNDAGERIASRAAEAGHASVEDYVRSLVLDAAAAETDPGPPPGASVSSEEELGRLIAERWDDEEGSFEPDEAFYENLRELARNGRKRAGE